MRKYLIAGLLVWMPVGITFLIIRAVIDFLDKILLWLPASYQPDVILEFHIPGLGVVLAIILVRSLYTGIKQILEAVLAADAKSFRKVLLIEYPRKGVWSLAFMTSDSLGEVQFRTKLDMISVFIPTTPNPTSGFVLIVPNEDVIQLNMGVEEGLKMIISMGVVVPDWKKDYFINDIEK